MRYAKTVGLALAAALCFSAFACASATATSVLGGNEEDTTDTTGQTGSACPATELIAAEINTVCTGEAIAIDTVNRECDVTTTTVTASGCGYGKVSNEVRRRDISLQ